MLNVSSSGSWRSAHPEDISFRVDALDDDFARIVRAAKQAGAAEVELRVGGAIVTVRISSTAPEKAAEAAETIVL